MTEHKIDAKFEHKIKTPRKNVLAIWSLVLSLVGIFPLPFIVPSVASVICGHKAISQISQSGGSQTGSGMALAGLIISYIILSISFLSLISYLVGN